VWGRGGGGGKVMGGVCVWLVECECEIDTLVLGVFCTGVYVCVEG